jgi:hypothetical protein
MTEETAAADYIVQFANNVEQLNIAYMNFINYRIEVGQLEELSDEQKAAIRTTTNELRGYAILTGIQLRAINQKLNQKIDDIKPYLDKIKTQYDIPDDIEDFIIKVNNYLATNVLQTMLDTSIGLASRTINVP